MKNNLNIFNDPSLTFRAIQKIDFLVQKEAKRSRLFQGICNILNENRNHYYFWLQRYDKSDKFDIFFDAELEKKIKPTLKNTVPDNILACTQNALTQPGVYTRSYSSLLCTKCPLSSFCKNRISVSVQLRCHAQLYGVLSISIPRKHCFETEKQDILIGIANDISVRIYNNQLEKDCRKHRNWYTNTSNLLHERTKELSFFYSFSRLSETPNLSLEEIIQGTIQLIPSSFQYSEIAKARILLDGKTFTSPHFKESAWKLSRPISGLNKKNNNVEIFYIEEKPEFKIRPFLKEEESLLEAIAERLGKIIQRKQAEIALTKSEQRFRNLVYNSMTGISIIQDNQVVYQNPAQEKLFGPLPRSAKFVSFDEIHPEDLSKVKKFYQQLTDKNFHQHLDIDFRIYRQAKNSISNDLVWIFCRVIVIEYNANNAFLLNSMDITHTKELEHLLVLQDKMTSLGRVAAGIAHEIRNPLSGINIYLKTLEKVYNRNMSKDKIKTILDQIHTASNKIESVIKRVLDFSKPGEPKLISMDINQPVEEAINLSAVTLRKKSIRLSINLSLNLPKSYIEPQLIEQVVLNLINNAVEAMEVSDKLKKIEISSFTENSFVCVKVGDSGTGISQKDINHIFEPFYTTKTNSSGIGLSICHRIISDHNGTIEVSEGQLSGAEFCIKLPFSKGLR
ncbi:MAG: GHKL domain-containing protein [Desulfobacterales bacterium]|nr:GHKL domain-containing protein [Desulfobacterales bacterium]